jgi:Tetratricopeptide repeat
MVNLASTLSAQGDLSGARMLKEQALEGSRQLLGEAHPDTLLMMNNLAATLRGQGDLPGARTLLERVLDESPAVGGHSRRYIDIGLESIHSVGADGGPRRGSHDLQTRPELAVGPDPRIPGRQSTGHSGRDTQVVSAGWRMEQAERMAAPLVAEAVGSRM